MIPSTFQVVDFETGKVYYTAPTHGYCNQWLLDNFPNDRYTLSRTRLVYSGNEAASKNTKFLPHLFQIKEITNDPRIN